MKSLSASVLALLFVATLHPGEARAAPAPPPGPSGTATADILPMPPDSLPADGGVEALKLQPPADGPIPNPRAEDEAFRADLKLVLAIVGLIAGIGVFFVWRRLKVLSEASLQIRIDDDPRVAAPGETVSVGIRIRPGYDLEHEGLRGALLHRTYPGPRPKKERLQERTLLDIPIAPAGEIKKNQELKETLTVTAPADAVLSYDHAFGVDLPAGREAVEHWVLQVRLKIGDGEARAERLLEVTSSKG